MNDVNNKLIYWLDDYYDQFSSRWDKQKYIWKADAMHCMAMDFAFCIRPCYEKSKT